MNYNVLENMIIGILQELCSCKYEYDYSSKCEEYLEELAKLSQESELYGV